MGSFSVVYKIYIMKIWLDIALDRFRWKFLSKYNPPPPGSLHLCERRMITLSLWSPIANHGWFHTERIHWWGFFLLFQKRREYRLKWCVAWMSDGCVFFGFFLLGVCSSFFLFRILWLLYQTKMFCRNDQLWSLSVYSSVTLNGKWLISQLRDPNLKCLLCLGSLLLNFSNNLMITHLVQFSHSFFCISLSLTFPFF